MKKTIQIELLGEIDLAELITSAVRTEISKIKETIQPAEEYLTRKQAAKVLQVSLPTLDKWTKEGSIPICRIANQIRYIRSVIDEKAEDVPNMRYKR